MGDLSLADLQRFVAEAVRREASVDGNPDVAASVERLVAPSVRGMTPADRLEVYREQFWARHLQSLDEDFPTLTWVLGGRGGFRDLAARYLQAHPPRTWDLQRLGAELPAFLSSQSPWTGDRLALDAARLDWAFMEAFDAPDAQPFDPRVLAATAEETWPHVRLVFHPSVRLLALAHPVHELREAVKHGAAPARLEAVDTHLVIWRDAACFLRAVSIEAAGWELLDALRAGVPLGAACEGVARPGAAMNLSELGARLATWFQQWTANGWLTAIRLGE